MVQLNVKTREGGYLITFAKGGIKNIADLWGVGQKTLVVTDSGVPAAYARSVAFACKNAKIFTFAAGEESKNLTTLRQIWQSMVEMGLTRSDRVIAVGGGVVGDIAGLAAATYMRGIDFYNIPTTVLAQVDSSVGGKTAIDFAGYKNIVGAFYAPKGVLIDVDTLISLPKRQVAAGLSEAIKMAATHDKELFKAFEQEDIEQNLAELLYRAVKIKCGVVERDEKEAGERKVLNFGHTLAHALESNLGFEEMYHGECVALGMLPMCTQNVRARLEALYEKVGLPTKFPLAKEQFIEACSHDKKCAGERISIVFVQEIGSYEIRDMKFDEFIRFVNKAVI